MKREIKIIIGLGVINILLVVGVFLYVHYLVYFGYSEVESLPYDRNYDMAINLEARGLYEAALEEFSIYRSRSWTSNEDEAKLLYKMAVIADEKLGDCDRALAYYTMATSLNPEASWAKDANKATVVCMEKTGNKKQAQALLRQFTGDNGTPPEPEAVSDADESPTVAMIGDRKITWAEVERHMRMKVDEEKLEDVAVRNQLIQHYVFTLMMNQEAEKKGYDTDPNLRIMLEQARREALAAEYMKRELDDPEDQEQIKKMWTDLLKINEARLFPFPVTDVQDGETD
jgi:tetratricopeptide (TPR) repeat protein